MGKFVTSIVALCAVVCVMSGSAPTEAQTPAASVVVSGVDVDAASGTASVAVLDTAGNPVRGIPAEAFTARVDGEPVRVTGVSSAVDNAQPLGLVIAIDTSGSMSDNGALTAAKAAITPLVDALQADDRASLVIFANGVQTLVQPTGDQHELKTYLNALAPFGNTALYAAVSQSAGIATGLEEPRRAIVLLSDGLDFGNVSGGITRDQSLAAAAASGVPFFVVGLGKDIDAPYLRALSEPAGGQLLIAATPDELAGLYGKLAERLRAQYTVTFDASGLGAGDHEVTVSANGVSGTASFSMASASPSAMQFTGLEGELSEKKQVGVINANPSWSVRFSVDGQPAGEGTSVELDPWRYGPATSHTLTAVCSPPAAGCARAEATFRVSALAPVLTGPGGIEGARPGDAVQLQVQAQPGVPVTAIYSIDGREFERDAEAPYEFTVPADAANHGNLTIRLEGAGQSSEQTFAYGQASSGAPSYLLYGLAVLAAVIVVGATIYVARRVVRAVRNRPDPGKPADLSRVAEDLQEWAQERRGDAAPREFLATPATPPPPGAWGAFTVIQGNSQGLSFPLMDDTVLVGRGKFCAVRLKDRDVEEAHCVVSSELRLHASTPSCRVLVDGRDVRSAELREGSTVVVGSTVLRFSQGAKRAA